jgi:hypothetical protein
LDDQSFIVVGILPPDFKFPFWMEKAEIWATNATLPDEGMMERGARNFQVVARLKPGISLQAAQTEMVGIAGGLEQHHPGTNRNLSIALVGVQEALTKEVRTTLWLLFGVVLFVLLIACANFANLLLVRALSRQKELAIRAALGASGWRIARQLLAESLLLFGRRRAGRAGCELGHPFVACAESANPAAHQRDWFEQPGARIHACRLAPDGRSVRAGPGLESRAARSERRAQGKRQKFRGRGPESAAGGAGGW